MLHLSRSIFAVIGFGLAIYLIVTQNFKVMPFMNVALVGLLLTLSIIEIKARRKMNAIFSFIAVLILLFAAIFSYYVFYIYPA